MKLRYTSRARRQLDHIYAYIHERNPAAAKRVIRRIRYSANLLRDFPLIGRHGLVPGTHELVVATTPYLIVYRLAPDDQNAIELLGIYHGAQDRLGDLG
jgi:toxin ParE1/3/4